MSMNRGPQGTTYYFSVTSAFCSSCTNLVKLTLSKKEWVLAVEAGFPGKNQGWAKVMIGDPTYNAQSVIDVIKALGHEAVEVEDPSNHASIQKKSGLGTY